MQYLWEGSTDGMWLVLLVPVIVGFAVVDLDTFRDHSLSYLTYHACVSLILRVRSFVIPQVLGGWPNEYFVPRYIYYIVHQIVHDPRINDRCVVLSVVLPIGLATAGQL